MGGAGRGVYGDIVCRGGVQECYVERIVCTVIRIEVDFHRPIVELIVEKKR